MPVAAYGCEAWTLKMEEERCIQAFENKCIRNLLRIPWTRLMTNKQVYEIWPKRKVSYTELHVISLASSLIWACDETAILKY